jgi:membrane protease YdiL (CAAX protease family)
VQIVRRHPLASYGVVTFALSWACWLPLAIGRVVVRTGGWPSHAPGLAGPALAALALTGIAGGRAGLAQLARGLVRWRIGLGPALLVASPVALFAITTLITGRPVAWSALGEMNGFPAGSPIALWVLLVVVNGLGEEIGWRGYAFPELRRSHGLIAAALLLTPVWAAWHGPLFLVLESYRGLGAPDVVGFVLGLASGAIVLGWLYERSGRSLLAVASWHATFNLFTGTRAAHGAVAAVESTAVMVLAAALIALELRKWRQHQAAAIA